LLSNFAPYTLACIPMKVHQAERFPVNPLPQRKRTVHEFSGIVECNQARRQDTSRSRNGGRDGLRECINYGVIVVSRHSEDNVMRGIDAIRNAC